MLDNRYPKINTLVFDFLREMQTYAAYPILPDGIAAWIIKECFSYGTTARFRQTLVFSDGNYGYTNNGPVSGCMEQKICLRDYLNDSEECREWIHTLLQEHENADKDALRLIYSLSLNDAMCGFFASGYCYYLACMLQELTGKGTVCWHRSHGHILWVDESGCAYDIHGFFKDYNDGDMVPVSTLGELINDIKHYPGYTYRAPEAFHTWAVSMGVSDLEALSLSYMEMEQYDDEKTVEEQVMEFWLCPSHRKKCRQRIQTWLPTKC